MTNLFLFEKGWKLLFLSSCFLLCFNLHAQNYYVATNGDDSNGTGTNGNPWATITNALDNVPDGSTILVKAGTYNGRIRVRGSFPTGVLVKSEVPYLAKLRHSSTVLTAYSHSSGCHGITFDGFDIAHSGPGAGALVLHIDGNGNGDVHDITFQNCVLHDSYNNDIAKINHSCYNITIQGNLFFNQTGSDEHIDGNSVQNLIIQDNIFLNDFASSGRVNGNTTSSYIVIKDSDNTDLYTGSRDVFIRRNVFLNYEGSAGTNFVLIGEDGNPYFEAFDVLIENNLMLGNSPNAIRAPLGIKGGRQITFRNNTVAGNMPGNAFAFRFNTEGSNPANDSIFIYNNIWSDPSGTMNDFSDCPIGETNYFELNNNLYWNNGLAIPLGGADLINITDDANSMTQDPLLGGQSSLIIPHFNSTNNQFSDGSLTIREAFERLVSNYGTAAGNSPVINAANNLQAPSDDILGNSRSLADIGAVEFGVTANLRTEMLEVEAVLFPNPTSGLVTLKMESDFIGNVDLQLYALNGQFVQEKEAYKSSKEWTSTWNLARLPKGIYTLKIKTKTAESSTQVILIE